LCSWDKAHVYAAPSTVLWWCQQPLSLQSLDRGTKDNWTQFNNRHGLSLLQFRTLLYFRALFYLLYAYALYSYLQWGWGWNDYAHCTRTWKPEVINYALAWPEMTPPIFHARGIVFFRWSGGFDLGVSFSAEHSSLDSVRSPMPSA